MNWFSFRRGSAFGRVDRVCMRNGSVRKKQWRVFVGQTRSQCGISHRNEGWGNEGLKGGRTRWKREKITRRVQLAEDSKSHHRTHHDNGTTGATYFFRECTNATSFIYSD